MGEIIGFRAVEVSTGNALVRRWGLEKHYNRPPFKPGLGHVFKTKGACLNALVGALYGWTQGGGEYLLKSQGKTLNGYVVKKYVLQEVAQ